MSPPNILTLWRRLKLELLFFLWQRSSNLSDICFRSDFAFAFHRAHNPCLFLHGWLLNGGRALPPTTATTTAVRWQGPILLVAGHLPHGRYLPTTCGRHCSSEHTPRLGFWSHQFPASCVTWTTPQRNCPNPIHQGAHSSSRFWVASVSRQLVAWTTPQRNCPSSTHQACSLRAQPACCTAHLRELPAPASRSPVDLYFFRASGLRHMHHAPRTSILESTLGPATRTSLAERAHRRPYTFADGARQTDLRGTPLDFGHRALGAHIGAPSLWPSLGRNRRCSWNVWAFFLVWQFFPDTRYRMGLSTIVDPSCASNKLMCSFSAENSTDTNLTQPGPLPDLSRSTAFHCVT